MTRPVAGGGAPGDTRRHAMGIRIPAPPCIFSIWIDPEAVNPERWFDESVRQIEAIASMARNNPRTIAMARTAAECARQLGARIALGAPRRRRRAFAPAGNRRGAAFPGTRRSRSSRRIPRLCLGADYDGVPFLPEGMEDVTKLPLLTAELRRRGYEPAQVQKVLGLNLLRVLEANER